MGDRILAGMHQDKPTVYAFNQIRGLGGSREGGFRAVNSDDDERSSPLLGSMRDSPRSGRALRQDDHGSVGMMDKRQDTVAWVARGRHHEQPSVLRPRCRKELLSRRCGNHLHRHVELPTEPDRIRDTGPRIGVLVNATQDHLFSLAEHPS